MKTRITKTHEASIWAKAEECRDKADKFPIGSADRFYWASRSQKMVEKYERITGKPL